MQEWVNFGNPDFSTRNGVYFLLLQERDFSNIDLFTIVVFCNALSAMPFVLRILSAPFHNNMRYYENLCNSLGILGWQTFLSD